MDEDFANVVAAGAKDREYGVSGGDFQGVSAERPSVYIWPISGSMALLLRRSAMSLDVRPRWVR